MSQIYGDPPNTTSHLVQMTAQEREFDSGGRFIDRIPTGMAWGECSCGVRVEGSSGEPLPRAEVVAQLNAHLASVACPNCKRPDPVEITSFSDRTQRFSCSGCSHEWSGGRREEVWQP